MDYVVNIVTQYGIEAESPSEALKKVVAGEGVELSETHSAQPRPQRPAPTLAQAQLQGAPSQAAMKLEAERKADAEQKK